MAKVELTPAKLAEIKQKAAGCDPKYWIMDQHGDVVAVDFDNKASKLKIAEVEFLEDAEHIAAADPATVLAMVEEIEQLRRMERKWGQMLKNVKDTAPDLETFLSPDAFKINESEAGQ